MAKSNVLPVILIIVGIYLVGSQLGLFSINLFTSEDLLSDFIGKAGISSAMNSSPDLSIDFINEAINKYYAFGIFDGPIKVSPASKARMVEQMQRLNSNIRNQLLNEYGLVTTEDIFSPMLISTLQKESYSAADFDTIIGEFGKAPKRYCTSITLLDNRYQSVEIDNQAIAYCNSLPTNIFVKSGSKWSLVALPDLTFTTQERVCTTNITTGIGVCQLVQSDTKTLNLSKIKAELFINGNDIFIGIGNKGVESIDKITPKYEFAQYAYQIEQATCGIDTWDSSQANCVAVSNSPDVISASTGVIKESNKISDLWYGITKKGEGFTDPMFLIGIGAIVLALVLFMKK